MKIRGWNVKAAVAGLLALLMMAAVIQALGELSSDGVEGTGEYTVVTLGDVDFSADEAAEQFINRAMYPSRRLLKMKVGSQGSLLEGANRNLYLFFAEKISAVAAGEETSTVFTVTAEELYGQSAWTAEDLGVESLTEADGGLNQEALSTFQEMVNGVDLITVIRSMLADFPYDLYWYNKTTGIPVKGRMTTDCESSTDQWTISGSLTYSFLVTEDYQGDGPYTVNPVYGQSTAAAAENARAIVSELGSIQEDYTRLRAYKNKICDLTDYNDDAWGEEGQKIPYGNPWQLIWVFDGDPKTKVVCEGYSKAFKYLNDISPWKLEVITAFGALNGGAHMWNIVSMDDGENYLVDVTNCDMEKEGVYSDWLFLVGTADGSVAEGYTFYSNKYTYYSGYTFTEEQLTLASKNYLDPESDWEYSEAGNGTCVITAYRGSDAIVIVPAALDGLRVTGLRGADGPVFDTNVLDVVLPEGLQTMEGPVFQGCAGLTDLILPASMKKVEAGVFEGCTELYALLIASEECCLEKDALEGLEVMVFVPHGGAGWTEEACNVAGGQTEWIRYCNHDGETVEYLADHTETVEPTCSAEGIMEYWTCQNCGAMFGDEAGITAIEAPFIIEKLSHTPVERFLIVPTFAEPGSVQVICKVCGEKLEEAEEIPALIPISHSALRTPASLKQIGEEAFSETQASSILITDSVTAIGNKAFQDCKALRQIYIPGSVETFGDEIFKGCDVTLIIISEEKSKAAEYAENNNILFVELDRAKAE